MSELYNRIEALCKRDGITVTEMCRRAGVPRANLTELKKGRQQTLGPNTVVRIARYFKVSVDDLMEPEEKENAQEGGAVEDDLKFALFGGGGEITDEMFAEVKAFAAYVRAREDAKNKK